MGLGLSIVQAIAEHHNGKVTVNSPGRRRQLFPSLFTGDWLRCDLFPTSLPLRTTLKTFLKKNITQPA